MFPNSKNSGTFAKNLARRLPSDTRNSGRTTNVCAVRRAGEEILNSGSGLSLALADEKERAYQEGLAAGKQQRKPGGEQKGKLPTTYDKLVFLLYYLKVSPTFDVLGAQFGMNCSKACENVHALQSILYKALQNLGVMPHRELKTV